MAILYFNSPTNSDALLYTVPTGPSINRASGVAQVKVRSIVLSNTDSAARTVTLNLVQGGGAAATANQLVPAYTVQPNSLDVIDFPQGIDMLSGDTIRGLQSSSGKINVLIQGDYQ